VIRRVGLLIAGSLVCWLIVAGAVLLVGGGLETILLTAAAMGICLVPAILTLVIAETVGTANPELFGITALAGSVVRMVAVGAAAVLLQQQVEFFRAESWVPWVVLFYLVVLALETTAILMGRVQPPPAG
jgi:hypothetical protein